MVSYIAFASSSAFILRASASALALINSGFLKASASALTLREIESNDKKFID